MKFIINSEFGRNEFYSAIMAYADENHGKYPSYALIHPETRRNILITSNEDELGMKYSVVYYSPSKEKGILSTTKVFDLYLMQSFDVEPGFMIICG